jgi:2-methylcitrate dehydratase PrpD
VKELTALAEFIQDRRLAEPPAARFDRVKAHIVDTVGARLAGSRTDEGLAVGRLVASAGDDLASAVLAACAQTRCTEIDDIHLTSCTTPGSVVVSTAMALASAGGLGSVRDFVAAVLAGYESLIRLGYAIDGPAVLHRKVWPTYYAAAFGSAATAARAYGLSVEQTAGALSTALAFSSATSLPAAPASSSRWVTLGAAAANGVLAARSAREGLVGHAGAARALGGPASKRLIRGLGRRYLFDEIGMKPYPTARQGLSAVEAARAIVNARRLNPSVIDEIHVRLPKRQRAIVDDPEIRDSRFSSIVSLQYQIALALLEPDRLHDVRRTPPFVDDRVRELMSRIRVRRARELDRQYPEAWPARVDIKAGSRRFTRLVRHPHGDARNPFGWDDVEQKFRGLAAPTLGAGAADRVVRDMRGATADAPMPPLWELR